MIKITTCRAAGRLDTVAATPTAADKGRPARRWNNISRKVVAARRDRRRWRRSTPVRASATGHVVAAIPPRWLSANYCGQSRQWRPRYCTPVPFNSAGFARGRNNYDSPRRRGRRCPTNVRATCSPPRSAQVNRFRFSRIMRYRYRIPVPQDVRCGRSRAPLYCVRACCVDWCCVYSDNNTFW